MRIAFRHSAVKLLLVVLACQMPAVAKVQEADPASVIRAIVRADYEGDLAALRRLHATIPTSAQTETRQARLRYWKGFALWRRAINGANQAVPMAELAQDVRSAITEFEHAQRLDRSFADANIALISCYQLLTFFQGTEPSLVKQWVERFVALSKEVSAAAPSNPRFLWVQGQSEWYTPPGAPREQARARQLQAIATYQRGLENARRIAMTATDVFEPAWGEPELLMNLAWAHLNGVDRDVAAARHYAEHAIALVPHWQYVRDLLLPQIIESQKISGTEARQFVGRQATVCGFVAGARYDHTIEGRPTFLNLDKPFPSQTLTVVIFGSERSMFGEPERLFNEKRICATGLVEELRQPPGLLRIVVRSPSQVREMK